MNETLLNLETIMDTMTKDPAESSCAIQSQLDALSGNSISQDKLLADKPQGKKCRLCRTATEQTGVYTVTTDCNEYRGRGLQYHYEGWYLKLDESTGGLEHTHKYNI